MKDVESIERLVDKYMSVLGVVGERPEIEIRDNLGTKWVGRCIFNASHPGMTVIQIQERVLSHARTLERVVAHEMIHHAEALQFTPGHVSMIRLGIQGMSHGKFFREGQALVNSLMGDNFVTEKSDSDDVLVPNSKEYYLLITPLVPGSDRLGWAWAVRLTPQMNERIGVVRARGGRLIKTVDERWTTGPKIHRHNGMAYPTGSQPEVVEALRRLYDEAAGK